MSIFRHLKIQEDPEAVFQEGWLLCDLGDYEPGLAFLRRAIEKRYWVVDTLMTSRQFDGLRNHPEFEALLAQAKEGRERALLVYREAGGERLLGV